MTSNMCSHCIHYKETYAPYIKRMVMSCDVDWKLSPGCKKEYKRKDDKKDDRTN